MLPASRGKLAIRRMGALRRGPSLRAPDRAEEAWRSGDALSAPRAPSRSAACRPYRRDLHRGRTVQRRPRLARPRDGRSRPPPPRRRRVAREASGTHSPPREGSSGVVGARVRVPSVGNNQRTSSKRALLRRGDAHARVCAGRIAPPRHPVASHGTRPEGQAPRLGLRPHATLEWHQKQATFQPLVREHAWMIFPSRERTQGGRPTDEYHFTLDAAKHIIMVSRIQRSLPLAPQAWRQPPRFLPIMTRSCGWPAYWAADAVFSAGCSSFGGCASPARRPAVGEERQTAPRPRP